MSLGLFAAAIVLLEQHGAISVERLAQLLAVPERTVMPILFDISLQGHCTLRQFPEREGGGMQVTWIAHPEGVEA